MFRSNRRAMRLIYVRLSTFAFAIALVAAGLLPRVAWAQSGATTYSTTQRVFKVGVLLIDSTTDHSTPQEILKGAENPDPYIFYIADQRADLKPQGWTFINPLAPATVTAAGKSRWDARVGGNSGYVVGQKVTPNMATYWEVSLTDTPISQLLQYDLLWITNHRLTSFNDADREKMRKLVDAGGVLWLEDCGGMQIGGSATVGSPGSFFLNGLQFEGNSFGNFTSSGPAIYQSTHPLLNAPYALSVSEIANLGDKNYGNYHIATYLAGTNGQTGQSNTTETMPNPDFLVNVVGNTGAPKDPNTGQFLPYIAAGHYGSGSVILTSGDSGCDVNDYAGGTGTASGGNSGAYSGTNLQTAHSEDLKFLYNCVNWGSANNGFRRNSRHTAASLETLNAPLLPQFNFASLYRAADRINAKTAPLLVNGLMFVSGVDMNGAVTVRCYDTKPFGDYDGDGNYDDGLADASLGLPYDEIWRYTGGSATGSKAGTEQPSSPVLATTQWVSGEATVLGTQAPTDKVFVSGPDGTLYIFPAAQNLGVGSIPPTVSPIIVNSDGATGGYDLVATHGVAPSPVVYGEIVYQVEPDGQVRAVSLDPKTIGTVVWRSFVDGGAPYAIVPTATPTVGFSQLYPAKTALARASGGNTDDLMLYVPAEVTSTNSTTASGQILAYLLGSRNEVQGFIANGDGMGTGSGAGSTAIIDTRLAGGGGSTLAGALYVAPGPAQLTGSPFTPFAIRVYAAGIDPADNTFKTARQFYELGKITADYTGTAELNGSNYPSGRVIITKTNTNVGDPGLQNRNTSQTGPANNPDILVSVDYDVMYITTIETPNKPVNYDAVNQNGARVDPNLVFANYLSKTQAETAATPSSPLGLGTPGGGIDTMALSPDDLLLFGVDQGITPSTGGAPTSWVTSVEALHEQANATTLLWRFGLHDPGAADGIADGQAIVDSAPIFNYNLLSISAGTYSLPDVVPHASLPEYISGLKMVGSPITTNAGLTYVMASGMSTPATNATGTNPNGLNQGPVTVLMAFETNPSITLTLPISFDATAPVQISQVSSLDNTTTISAGAANAEGSTQLTVDAQRGKITIVNFIATGGQFSASQSFVATVTPLGQTTPVRFVVHPLPPSASSATYIAGNGQNETGTINPESGGYTPLQFYYVLPGTPTSSPSLIGDYLFFNMTPTVTPNGGAPVAGANCVAAVDANPAANDAAVRVGFGEPVLNIKKHLHWLQPLLDQTGGTTVVAYGAPSGSQGTLVTSSSIGAYAFEDQVTLIADGKRILETGPDGGASWTLDSTQLTSIQGGDLPIYGPNNNLLNADSNGNPPTGRTTVLSQTLAHPTVSRKIGNGDYLIADSGNNRVMRVDRGGKITFKLDTIADPYNLMAGSDPKTLSGPTDVQYYIAPSIVNGSAAGYEVHYLVADPGNFRIVEVADYFDAKGTQIDSPYPHTGGNVASSHSLVWITRTQSTQGQRLTYTNIQRFLGTDPTNTYSGYPYVIATVGNSSVGGASSSGGADFTGGALVSLHYAPYATALPINALSNGASSVTVLWPSNAMPLTNEPLANGTVLASANDLRETTGSQTFGTAGSITPTSSSTTFNIRKLTHPAFFTELNLPNTASGGNSFRNIYLICDSSSVYAIEATTDTAGNAVRDVLWKFTQADYDVMNAKRLYNANATSAFSLPNGVDESQLPRFVPSSVKLLPNGDFLITNSFYGRSPLFKSGQFNGEVFQVTPLMTPGSVTNASPATVNPPSGMFSLYTASSSTQTAQGGVFDSFAAPKIDQILVNTVFTGQFLQQMGANGNTNLLEQPLFADRP